MIMARRITKCWKTIPPGDQMWVNLTDLIRHRTADRKGSVLPVDVSVGTYDVQDLIPARGEM